MKTILMKNCKYTGSCYEITVWLDDRLVELILSVTCKFLDINGDLVPFGTFSVNRFYDVELSGITVMVLQEAPQSVPVVHIGAKLMDKNSHEFCEVIAVSEGLAWCRFDAPNEIDRLLLCSNLVERITPEDVLVEEALKWVDGYDTDHDPDEMNQLTIAVRDLIKAGYRKVDEIQVMGGEPISI